MPSEEESEMNVAPTAVARDVPTSEDLIERFGAGDVKYAGPKAG